MSKLWYPSAEELSSIRVLMNEDRWFEHHQDLLLGMANTNYGRDLLCIPKEYPKICRIAKNCVQYVVSENANGTVTLCVDFRIGAKWGNVIRSRWAAFNSYARYFVANEYVDKNTSPVVRFHRAVCALTLTAYPDPNVETTTVDGFVEYYLDPGVFLTMNAASAANTANDSGANINGLQNSRGGATEYNLQRGFALFDTSSLTSGATISSAVFSLYGSSKNNANSDSARMVTSTPASNTALVVEDWDQTGTVALANDITFASASTTGYNDFTMTDLTAVSKTGVSKFGMRTTNDIAASAPTGSNFLTTTAADTGGTSQDPKLVVTYTLGGATARRLGLLGVGQ